MCECMLEVMLAVFCALLLTSVSGDSYKCYDCQAAHKVALNSMLADYEPMVNVTGRTSYAACQDKADTSMLTKSYQCSNSDKCFKFTMEVKDSAKFVYRGCLTSNQCSAMTARTEDKKREGTWFECCTGNLCNAAARWQFTLLLIIPALLVWQLV